MPKTQDHPWIVLLFVVVTGVAAAALVRPPQALAQVASGDTGHRPGEVLVRYRAGVGPAQQAWVEASAGTASAKSVPGGSKRLEIADGASVQATAVRLRRDPRVVSA